MFFIELRWHTVDKIDAKHFQRRTNQHIHACGLRRRSSPPLLTIYVTPVGSSI